jgi:hypothetical protein
VNVMTPERSADVERSYTQPLPHEAAVLWYAKPARFRELKFPRLMTCVYPYVSPGTPRLRSQACSDRGAMPNRMVAVLRSHHHSWIGECREPYGKLTRSVGREERDCKT